jgi:hypothetical protein
VVESSFDVFISYRHTDAEHVRSLASALAGAGLSYWLDERAIEDFQSIQTSIERGLGRSKALFAWYSAQYPESRACQWELSAAFLAAQSMGDVRQRILLANPEPGNAHVHPVELRDALYSAAPTTSEGFEAIAGAVAKHCRGLTGTFGDVRSAHRPTWFGDSSGLGSERFVGRHRELWAIHSALHASVVPIITHRTARPVVWLTGLGGAGKSLLAEEYALRFGAAYPGGVVWLRARGEVGDGGRRDLDALAVDCERQLASLASRLHIATNGRTPDAIRTDIGAALEQRGSSLFVVDDLPSGLPWSDVNLWTHPATNGHTLITTRRKQSSGQGAAVHIEDLDPQSALSLLCHRRAPSDLEERNSAVNIVGALAGHPLAIELAAVGVDSAGYVAFERNLRSRSEDDLAFAEELLKAEGTVLPHREAFSQNLALVLLSSIKRATPDGQELLRLCAQIASAPISCDLACRAFELGRGEEVSAARRRIERATFELASHGLVRRTGSIMFEVHALVSRTVRFHLGSMIPEDPELLRGALSALAEGLQDACDSSSAETSAAPVEHARAMVGLLERPTETSLDGAYVRMLTSLASCYLAQGKPQTASVIARLARNAAHAFLGGTRACVLAAHALAASLLARGAVPGAIAEATLALDESLETLGEDDDDTLKCMQTLGLAYLGDRQLEAAHQLIARVVQGRAKRLGRDHPSTLRAMLDFADVLRQSGERPLAKKFIEGVLNVQRRTLGLSPSTHLEALRRLSDLAADDGDKELELATLDFAVETARAGLGPDHPETMNLIIATGGLAMATGHLGLAQARYEELVELLRRIRGPAHPDVEHALAVLAHLHCLQSSPQSAPRPKLDA